MLTYIQQCGSKIREINKTSSHFKSTVSEPWKMYKICQGHHMVNMQSNFVDVCGLSLQSQLHIECLDAVLFFKNFP